MIVSKKGDTLQTKIAQNRLPRVLFVAENEYDTLRCNISSITHDTPEKGCQITNKNRSK